MKILEVKILDKFNNFKFLRYKIFDTSLANRWANLTKTNLENKQHKIVSSFSNRTKLEISEITLYIKNLVLSINQIYDKEVNSFDSLDRSKLNYLHEEFELFGQRTPELISKGIYTEDLANLFFSLNEQIHVCENAMAGGFGILYDIHPLGLHLPVEEQDKLFLEPFFTWGRLYLGYNTLGKGWLDAARDNDWEVIQRDMIKPQRRFASEAWLNFIIDQEKQERVEFFLNWTKSIPSKLQNKIPFDNLNELTLGNFPIGDIIIDSEFLKIDPNINHWKVHRHPCKLKWTYEILPTFRSIESVRILDL